MAKPAATAVPACAMAGFDELAGRAGVLPVKTVGDELAIKFGAAGAVEVGAGVGAVDPGTYVEIEVAAGDEVAVVAAVGVGDAIDTGAELATMTGVGIGVAMTGGGGGAGATMTGVGEGVAITGGGGGAGATKTGTGGEGAAVGGTGAEADVVVMKESEVAMIN